VCIASGVVKTVDGVHVAEDGVVRNELLSQSQIPATLTGALDWSVIFLFPSASRNFSYWLGGGVAELSFLEGMKMDELRLAFAKTPIITALPAST